MSDAVTATTLTIRLLGGFRVLIGNDPVPARAWRLRKAQVLVQMLALAPHHALHREQIMDLLWPHHAPAAAARNLHQVVHAARRALAGAAGPDHTASVGNPVVVRQQVVRLQPEGRLWVDALVFEKAAAQALETGEASSLDAALALYEGTLLPENPYDDAFAEPRRRLADLRLRLLQEKAAAAKAAGHWEEALAVYRTILDDDPTLESNLADLLRVCRFLNARDEAARYFKAYRRQISRELGLDPNPELVRLFQWVRQGQGSTGWTGTGLSGSKGSGGSKPASTSGATARRGAGPAPKTTTGRGAVPATKTTDGDEDGAGIRTGSLPPAHQPAVATAGLPLVAREAELSAITTALADRSQGHIFVIAGEPGIGKSRLVQEASRQAVAMGLPVAMGFGIGPDETPPFGPWRQILHEYSAGTGRSRRDLPAPLGEAAPSPSGMELALELAAFLTAGPPAVIVLEDLHWFDAASIQLLHHGLTRYSRSPVHLLITCRSQSLDTRRELASLTRALIGRGARWLELPRLDVNAVKILARAMGRPERASLVHERSGGNPFFACQLLLADGTQLPWTVKQAVAERLAAVGKETLPVLRIGAVLGIAFTAKTLQAATGLPGDRVDSALDESLQQGIIRRQEGGYSFDHPLVREVLTEGLSRSERVKLHRLAAAASDDPDEIAYHLGAAGDPAAVPQLLAAGRRAMLWGADQQAKRHFRRALELASPHDPVRCELMLLLAVRTEAEVAAPALAEQRELLDTAIVEAQRTGDALVVGLACRLLAESLFLHNDDRALDLYERSLNALAQAGDSPRAEELKALVDRRVMVNPGHSPLMYALHRHSPEADPVTAVQSAVDRVPWLRSFEERWAAGFAHIMQGNVEQAAEEMLAGGERAFAARNYITAACCFAAANNLRLLHMGTDRKSIDAIAGRVMEAMEQARRLSENDPFPDDNLMMPYWYWYGQWDKVRQAYDVFVAAGGTISDSVALFGYVYGAEVTREQGNPRASLIAYQPLLPAGGPGSSPGILHFMPHMAYITLAIKSMIAAGEHDMAKAWLDTIDAWQQGPRPNRVNQSWLLIQRAEWHRAQGDLAAMGRAAAGALAMARNMPATWVELNGLRLLGAAGGAQAGDCMARALELAEACGYPFEIARIRLERGRPDDLAAAREIFTRLGARPYLEQIRTMEAGRA
ncbi:MAG TPA: AAA family ATPase [Sphingobacteriaceae bacterium]|nr:AAA family ATPase [Sphingobacteriaceae bacterium]